MKLYQPASRFVSCLHSVDVRTSLFLNAMASALRDAAVESDGVIWLPSEGDASSEELSGMLQAFRCDAGALTSLLSERLRATFAAQNVHTPPDSAHMK